MLISPITVILFSNIYSTIIQLIETHFIVSHVKKHFSRIILQFSKTKRVLQDPKKKKFCYFENTLIHNMYESTTDVKLFDSSVSYKSYSQAVNFRFVTRSPRIRCRENFCLGEVSRKFRDFRNALNQF